MIRLELTLHRAQWLKKRKYRANPNKPKLLTFRPEGQPHAKTCACLACRKYLNYLRLHNPARYAELTEESTFIPLKRTELQKQFANEKVKRERLGMTLTRYNFPTS